MSNLKMNWSASPNCPVDSQSLKLSKNTDSYSFGLQGFPRDPWYTPAEKQPKRSQPQYSSIGWCDQLPTSSSSSLTSSSLSMPPPSSSSSGPINLDLESDERPYRCDLCTCTYKHASSLINHKHTHRTGDFRCDFCNKPYSNYMSLRNHMRIHGQKNYLCKRCGKAFRLARHLRNHQKVHDEGPNRFGCPTCGKHFRSMLDLARHRCKETQVNKMSGSCARLPNSDSSDTGRQSAMQSPAPPAPPTVVSSVPQDQWNNRKVFHQQPDLVHPRAQDLGHRPQQDLGHRPQQDLGHRPQQDLGHRPQQDLGHRPQQDLGHRPQHDLGHRPQQDLTHARAREELLSEHMQLSQSGPMPWLYKS